MVLKEARRTLSHRLALWLCIIAGVVFGLVFTLLSSVGVDVSSRAVWSSLLLGITSLVVATAQIFLLAKLAAAQKLRILRDQTGPVYGVSVTADGKRAVSASDHALKLWDVERVQQPTTRACFQTPIHWNSVKNVFERDGSLREIYVFDTNEDDWEKFLAYLKAGPYILHFEIGGCPSAVPDYGEIRAVSHDTLVLLTVDPGGLHLNCISFAPSEIELDLWPTDIAGPEALCRLLDFVRAVGNLLGKPIIITPEGEPDIPLISFDPTTGNWDISA